MDLDKAIRKVKDFPKPGILFYDVTSIFTDPIAFRFVINRMLEFYLKEKIDGVIAIESRGFLIGSCFALERKPIRYPSRCSLPLSHFCPV